MSMDVSILGRLCSKLLHAYVVGVQRGIRKKKNKRTRSQWVEAEMKGKKVEEVESEATRDDASTTKGQRKVLKC